MQSIKEAKVKGKTVLLRMDLDVPVKKSKVIDDTRLKAGVPTIKHLLKKGTKVLLLGHRGRPKGKKVKKLSTEVLKKKISKLIGKKVEFVPDCLEAKCDERVCLLENVRFYPGEKKNSAAFAKKLAKNADLYVNDAFATCHRKHASVHAITKYLPSYAGLNLTKELKALDRLIANPKKPFIVVLGGVKVSTKIEVIESLAEKADCFLIGGGMANTFLKAQGLEIGKSKYEEDKIKTAKKIMKKHGKKIELPEELMTQKGKKSFDNIGKKDKVLDLGPKTISSYTSLIKEAKTVFWNGPMGLFEKKPYDKGTRAIGKAIAESKAKSLVGGGETLRAVKSQLKHYSHVSTGGGAMLEYIAGKKLPGIEALNK